MGPSDKWADKQIRAGQLLKITVQKGQFNAVLEWWDQFFVKLKRDDGSRVIIHKSRIISLEKIHADGSLVLEQEPDDKPPLRPPLKPAAPKFIDKTI